MTAFRPPSAAYEILITVRRSLPAFNVPCQVPVMSCANSAGPNNVMSAMIQDVNLFMSDLQEKFVLAILLRFRPATATDRIGPWHHWALRERDSSFAAEACPCLAVSENRPCHTYNARDITGAVIQ